MYEWATYTATPWTVREAVRIYSTWKAGRKPLRTLGKGERVTALTGIHATLQPAEIRVTRPIPQYGLKPGDTVFAYMNLGEGFFNAWFNGSWVREFDGSGVDGLGGNRNCTANLLKPGRVEWWEDQSPRRRHRLDQGNRQVRRQGCPRPRVSRPSPAILLAAARRRAPPDLIGLSRRDGRQLLRFFQESVFVLLFVGTAARP